LLINTEEWIQHKTIRLLPQDVYLFQQGQGPCNIQATCVCFGLQLDGRFSYGPAACNPSGGALSGAGTTTLIFKGYAVSVDASAVSRFLLVTTLRGAKPVQNGKTTVVVLPAPAFFLQTDNGMRDDLMFSVGAHGEVMLDPKKTGGLEVLAGNPPTLRVLANADPMNADSPEDVVTQRYNNLRTGTTLHGGLDKRVVSGGLFGLIGIGRFGLGFKSLLALGGKIDLFSRSVSIRFDPIACQKAISEELKLLSDEMAPSLRMAEVISFDGEARRDRQLVEFGSWAMTIARPALFRWPGRSGSVSSAATKWEANRGCERGGCYAASSLAAARPQSLRNCDGISAIFGG
jgi:hypothetical protein